MKRVIKFEKFRNIGLDEPQFLVLNSQFEKGKLGNILVIIGSNNSGKSNVLDGITKLSNNSLEERDITSLSLDDKDRNPSISLCYQSKDFEAEYSVSYGNESRWSIKKNNLKQKDLKISKETVISNFKRIADEFSRWGYGLNLSNYTLYKQILADNDFSFSSYNDEIMNFIDQLMKTYRGYSQIWNSLKKEKIEILQKYLDSNNTVAEIENVLGVHPIPTICEYKKEPLSSSDLHIGNVRNNINGSRFFRSLFKAINVDINIIINAYNDFQQKNNIAILQQLQEKMKSKINKINDQFNKMYFSSDDPYKFSLVFESGAIYFGMARGKENDPITLEYQSTGFRWFFDFFFNFLTSKELQPGDIVIMDEPATHLHPNGQQELRRFIKDFAVKNDILFIIATHSPFMLDIDNYDELRVVSIDNNRSTIDNCFTAVNLDDQDTLLPIKEYLTIKQNVLYDLDTEVVWVEGITDYIYLTMFKNILGIQKIAFLPFNGVGDNNSKTKEILKKLIDIKFYKRGLLVDADKAGLDMYKLAQESAFGKENVHNISEVVLDNGKKAMMIEDLFSSEDKKKYPAITIKKSLDASEVKIHAKKSDFSESTIKNFEKLFKILTE